MSGGSQEIVINPSERAISNDQNRAQRFRGLDLNELLRALVDTDCGLDDVQASSFDNQSTITTSPPSAAVFNGLVVRPQIGSLNLLVDPGVIGLYDPDPTPNPDESQYKVIRDPGVQIAGALQLTSNTSGGTIISVIECARVTGGFSVLETDNRDIFSPITGLFTASIVNKVVAGRLQYRVRSGGSGGGFPGTALGWVPLCVVSQPTGTGSITTTDMTFWDVRPFVGDRLFPPHNLKAFASRARYNRIQIDLATSAGKALLAGSVDATATDTGIFGGAPAGLYRLGGQFNSTLDLNVAGNQSGAIITGVGYVYLLEPFGLPRWAIYNVQSGVLVPGNPRGIPTVSMTAPVQLINSPSAPLALPLSTGLGGATSKAACIAATPTVGSAVGSVVTDGHTQTSGSASLFGTKTYAVSGSLFKGSYAAGVDYPPNATALHLNIVVVTGAVPATFLDAVQISVFVQDSTNTHVLSRASVITDTAPNPTAVPNALALGYRVKIPVPANQPTFGVMLDPSGSSRALGSVNVDIVGWDVA